MMEAPVGDEQRGEDPTTRALEDAAASLMGHDDAVFLPSATMANQIALFVQTKPGDAVIVHRHAHLVLNELGASAVHSGLMTFELESEDGHLDLDQVELLFESRTSIYSPIPRLISIENSHNASGGQVLGATYTRAVADLSKRHGAAFHVDGARLLNAAVALGVEPRDLADCADSVTLCLSKGLGCPVGALLVGRQDVVASARRAKHLFGGAMRQSGVLAAAGLYALEHNIGRLHNDHARARRLADGWAAAGIPAAPERVVTNFLQIDATSRRSSRDEMLGSLRDVGVLVSPTAGFGKLRAVTHLDVTETDVNYALSAGASALSP